MYLFAEKPALTNKQKSSVNSASIPNGPTKSDLTWVHEIFQGTLTNETLCLNCETVSTISFIQGIIKGYCAKTQFWLFNNTLLIDSLLVVPFELIHIYRLRSG